MICSGCLAVGPFVGLFFSHVSLEEEEKEEGRGALKSESENKMTGHNQRFESSR